MKNFDLKVIVTGGRLPLVWIPRKSSRPDSPCRRPDRRISDACRQFETFAKALPQRRRGLGRGRAELSAGSCRNEIPNRRPSIMESPKIHGMSGIHIDKEGIASTVLENFVAAVRRIFLVGGFSALPYLPEWSAFWRERTGRMRCAEPPARMPPAT